MAVRGGLVLSILVLFVVPGCRSHRRPAAGPDGPYLKVEYVKPGLDCSYRTRTSAKGCVVHEEERRAPPKGKRGHISLVERDVKMDCGRIIAWCDLTFYCRCPR